MPKDPFSLFEYFGQEANARLTLAYPSASEAERFVMFRKELRLNRKTPGYWCPFSQAMTTLVTWAIWRMWFASWASSLSLQQSWNLKPWS